MKSLKRSMWIDFMWSASGDIYESALAKSANTDLSGSVFHVEGRLFVAGGFVIVVGVFVVWAFVIHSCWPYSSGRVISSLIWRPEHPPVTTNCSWPVATPPSGPCNLRVRLSQLVTAWTTWRDVTRDVCTDVILPPPPPAAAAWVYCGSYSGCCLRTFCTKQCRYWIWK